jgi:hypothetical protein
MGRQTIQDSLNGNRLPGLVDIAEDGKAEFMCRHKDFALFLLLIHKVFVTLRHNGAKVQIKSEKQIVKSEKNDKTQCKYQ